EIIHVGPQRFLLLTRSVRSRSVKDAGSLSQVSIRPSGYPFLCLRYAESGTRAPCQRSRFRHRASCILQFERSTRRIPGSTRAREVHQRKTRRPCARCVSLTLTLSRERKSNAPPKRVSLIPSALSLLNFGVDRLELGACVVNFHLPVDSALSVIDAD